MSYKLAIDALFPLQALFKLSNDFRKEETRFLNRVEAQKGIKVGGTMGLVENDAQVSAQGNSLNYLVPYLMPYTAFLPILTLVAL